MMRANKSLLKSISNSNLKRPQEETWLQRQWFFQLDLFSSFKTYQRFSNNEHNTKKGIM